jgi:hypothetical protein
VAASPDGESYVELLQFEMVHGILQSVLVIDLRDR